MTTGLLLLTTDGDAVHRLTHPRYRVERSYTALVHGRSTAEIGQAIQERVLVDGKPVVAVRGRVRPGTGGRSILDVTLTEGRNRIVRKWCEAMGLKVERLARLSYGPVRLGDLSPGESRLLTPAEEAGIYAAIGLKKVGAKKTEEPAAKRAAPGRTVRSGVRRPTAATPRRPSPKRPR